MSEDKIVEVEGLTSDNATLLLAAAAELGLSSDVVATTSRDVFLVPESVAKKSGLVKPAAKKAAASKNKEE